MADSNQATSYFAQQLNAARTPTKANNTCLHKLHFKTSRLENDCKTTAHIMNAASTPLAAPTSN
jgi:hypothetical protein